jgi:hypothetical protein
LDKSDVKRYGRYNSGNEILYPLNKGLRGPQDRLEDLERDKSFTTSWNRTSLYSRSARYVATAPIAPLLLSVAKLLIYSMELSPS